MRRVKHLLTQIRRATGNDTNVTPTSGISDDELIETLNNAQSYLQQELEQINKDPFIRESFIDTVADQEAYDLPDRTYLGHNLVLVEYTPTSASASQTETYYKLRKIGLHERRTVTGGFHPQYYVVRNKQILLSPIPSTAITNGLRINSVQQLPRLDKRRAKLDAVTVTSGEITALSVDITDYADYFTGASAFDSSSILVDDKFCVVGADGTIKARNIPITAIEATAGNATITSYTPESTSETAAVGDYLVAGANATTHSELPNACEPFLISWGKWQVYEYDDHHDDSLKEMERLRKLEDAIRGSWHRISDDVQYIPIINTTYLYG